jgi:3-deoxy-manno-octulosonate cytidylyltransferase (CMP-KDO synthetase)
VEQHGENPVQNIVAIIPARYASVRLPGKLLMNIAGKPLIVHTMERAHSAASVSRVLVATDDERIFRVVSGSGGEAMMTSPDHQSGSDRIAEVAKGLPAGTVVVNVQGDEPLVSPKTIDLAVEGLIGDDSADIATTAEAITSPEDILDQNVVKVVTDREGYALYFSRSPIPFPRRAASMKGTLADALLNETDLLKTYRKHTGLYVYRREYLLEFTKLSQTPLEKLEMLEQLRALENGARIKVVEADGMSIGVDTAEDLERVRSIIESHD